MYSISACRAIGQKYNMPMELAFDLCTLALYDVAIYADDSTSMKYAEGACNQSVIIGAMSTLKCFVHKQLRYYSNISMKTVAYLCM